MRPRRQLLHVLLGVVLGCAAAQMACDDGDKDKDAAPADGTVSDGPMCRRPPNIEQCSAPPNMYSDDRYYCACIGACGGGTPTAACNQTIGDCRFFYDDCIPETYSRCDENATDFVLGLCGYCFFIEAGIRTEPLEDCDKLSQIYGDANLTSTDGSAPTEDSSGPTGDGSAPTGDGSAPTGDSSPG